MLEPATIALQVGCLTCGAPRAQPCRSYLPRRVLEQPHPSRAARAALHGHR